MAGVDIVDYDCERGEEDVQVEYDRECGRFLLEVEG